MTDLSKWRPLNIKNTQLFNSQDTITSSIDEEFATKPFSTCLVAAQVRVLRDFVDHMRACIPACRDP